MASMHMRGVRAVLRVVGILGAVITLVASTGNIVHLSVHPKDKVPLGASITLTCQVDNAGYGSGVRWYLNDVRVFGYRSGLQDANDRYREDAPIMGTWRFMIASAQNEDSGTWRCETEFPPPNSLRSSRKQMQLKIGVPSILSLSRDIETTLRSYVRLQCNVSAEPDASVMWRKATPQPSLPSSASIDPITNALSFRVMTIKDGGVYECVATNVLGTVVGRVIVNVIHAPVIDTALSDDRVVSWINLPVNLTCAWSAYPTPRVSWDRSGVMVDQTRVRTYTSGSISVLQVSPTTTDFVTYRCFVDNNRGRAVHTVALDAAATPSAPGNVRAGAITHDTVTLLLDPPQTNGGLAVTDHRVGYRETNVLGLRWKVVEFPIGQNTIITGLKPDTEYLFKVAAGNAVGYGNYSDVIRISTPRQYASSPGMTTFYPNVTHTTSSFWLHNDTFTHSTDADNTTSETDFESGFHGPSPFAIVIGALVAVFLSAVLIFLITSLRIFNWHKKRPTEEQHLCRNRPNSIFSDASLFQLRNDSVQYDVMPMTCGPGLLRGEFEFPRYKLVFGTVLGTGSFGKVVRGEADGILRTGAKSVVAIKTLKENATPNDHQDLLKELGVMKILKPHPNIVTLFGCCTGEDPPLIIMEYLPNGNLLQHLRNSRQRVEDAETHRASIRTTMSPTDLIRYAYEIANGMTYLASMMCIHRDLAARNILLSRDGVCKLSDFGLARDVVNGGIYQRKTQGRVPIRWMALESLLDNVYTIQSDVWSFAVLMWEIVTIGSYPFPGMSSKRLIKELQRGYRMPRPDHCSGDVYDMMIDCWRENPASRPTFENLRNRLEAILIESRNYLVLDFDEHLYDYTYSGSSDGVDI
ncbi:fibroblast growth factor receptor 4-like isoform X2 [Patiria miniata]|uniref:receptor protein-tyrosine kinase n=1 Tax=Patiria miniata TaxID=46514 RepID=A0A914AQH1_PATMI|nr:fibroblast growth factor receptor 4-like isoform X2 [Patiria miniata]